MKKRMIIGGFVFSVLLVIGGYISIFRITSNIHEVDPGRFYRSAQLTAGELKEVVGQFGIQTVISLRGVKRGSSWYVNEIKAAEELGIRYETLAFQSNHLNHPRELKKLMILLEEAPRPILIHCRSGADRVGEVSAIYAMEYMGWDKERALSMLSSQFYHVELFTPAKKFFIRQYQGPNWVFNEYNPCQHPFDQYYQKEDFCDPQTQTVKEKYRGGLELFEQYQKHKSISSPMKEGAEQSFNKEGWHEDCLCQVG